LQRHFDRKSVDVAFAAALIWAVHPLNSEVVHYVTQRSESMAALLLLVTLYAANRALFAKGRGWQTVAIVSCALGMLCKESMVIAPVLVVLYERVFVFDSWRHAFRERAGLYLGLAATWLVLAGVTMSGPRSEVAGFSSGVSPWTYLLNQTLVITRYLRLSVWPTDLVLFYGWPAPLALGDVYLHALFVLTLLLATVVALVRSSALGFLGAWFFLTLAPTSSIVPIATEVGAERRMYLPLAAIIVIASVTIHALGKRWGTTRRFASVPAMVFVGVTAALAMGTVARNREYASALSLAQTVVERRPTAIAHHILGEQLLLAGRDAEATVSLREAVALGDSRAGYQLGAALSNQGRLDDALQQLDAYVHTSELPYRLVPRWLEPPVAEVVNARILMARIHIARRDWPRAAEQAAHVLRVMPSQADAQLVLAGASFGQERWEEASVQYREYLKQRPSDGQAWINLGVARVASGDLDQAVDAFRRAVEVDPANKRARELLGMALKDRQR
jgi:Flp pilus assembly protein TadD